GCRSRMSPSFAAASSSVSTPSARHMRRSEPNWLIRSGCDEPFGLSNRSAGPPDFTTRSVISVISRSGSASTEMRRSSPARWRSAIHARRSRGGLATARVSLWTRRGLVTRVVALARAPVPQIGEQRETNEDDADEEHHEDDVAALLGRRLLLCLLD